MWYIVEYYSAMKKNEVMPFATAWIDREIIILSEVSLTEKNMISFICRIFFKWYEWTSKTHRLREKPMATGGRRGDSLGVWDWHAHAAIFKTDGVPWWSSGYNCASTTDGMKGCCCELCVSPGFVTSGGEDFNLGSEMRLDYLGNFLYNQVSLKYRDRESFWRRHQTGTERVPPC